MHAAACIPFACKLTNDNEMIIIIAARCGTRSVDPIAYRAVFFCRATHTYIALRRDVSVVLADHLFCPSVTCIVLRVTAVERTGEPIKFSHTTSSEVSGGWVPMASLEQDAKHTWILGICDFRENLINHKN